MIVRYSAPLELARALPRFAPMTRPPCCRMKYSTHLINRLVSSVYGGPSTTRPRSSSRSTDGLSLLPGVSAGVNPDVVEPEPPAAHTAASPAAGGASLLSVRSTCVADPHTHRTHKLTVPRLLHRVGREAARAGRRAACYRQRPTCASVSTSKATMRDTVRLLSAISNRLYSRTSAATSTSLSSSASGSK